MRRVLMVSPHFPPDSSAAAHRVRLLAPHLPEAGWTPTIVTLDPSAYEGRLDRDLEALVPAGLRIVRAPAWPIGATRWVGLGDLGLRAFTGLRHACRELLARERFDALFITIYPVYPALLGPGLKAEFGVPFVLDYQDPWVGAWGAFGRRRPNGRPDWKSRAARTLGTWLEPRAVAAADALVAVSQGTLDGIIERMPAAARLPQGVIPLGFEPDDFESLRRRSPYAAGVRSVRRARAPVLRRHAAAEGRSTRFACCCVGSNGRAARTRRRRACGCISSARAISRRPTRIGCCRWRVSAASRTR